MLNKNWSTTYKNLANKSETRECFLSEDPVSRVAVDVRSRLFRHLRRGCRNRPLSSKIRCVFGLLGDVSEQEIIVCREAHAGILKEVSILSRAEVTYVLSERTVNPFKEGITNKRKENARNASKKLKESMKKFRRNMFDVEAIAECHAAFEGYLIANMERLALILSDMFGGSMVTDESDKTCAQSHMAILSEDFDCLALFGGQMMIKEVFTNFFTYVTLSDVMDVFHSRTRLNLVHKCCLLGTDYNLGTFGIGPVKVVKIDEDQAREKFESCMHAQGIDVRALLEFFCL